MMEDKEMLYTENTCLLVYSLILKRQDSHSWAVQISADVTEMVVNVVLTGVYFQPHMEGLTENELQCHRMKEHVL